MTKIGPELLVERLVDRRVGTIFGRPGDGINSIGEALRRHQDPARLVLAMPGKVGDERASGSAEAFLMGQPHTATIATTLFSEKIAELRG